MLILSIKDLQAKAVISPRVMLKVLAMRSQYWLVLASKNNCIASTKKLSIKPNKISFMMILDLNAVVCERVKQKPIGKSKNKFSNISKAFICHENSPMFSNLKL